MSETALHRSAPIVPAPIVPAPIVFDEARLVVVDKPAGVTAEDTARAHGRRLVHRIDKGTSGLLVLADDARTVQRFHRARTQGLVTRRYLAVARGHVANGTLDAALVDDRGDGRRGIATLTTNAGVRRKTARTDIDVIAHAARHSLVQATLVTGRTHQVRIHLASAGHALVGDAVYGDDDDGHEGASRLLLHAWQLVFVHPNTHAPVALMASPPGDFLRDATALDVDVEAALARRRNDEARDGPRRAPR